MIYYKVNKNYLKVGQVLVITKWDNWYYKVERVALLQQGTIYYEMGRVLQSGMIITKWSLTLFQLSPINR